ncbi:hypothetical protein EBB59_04435 [Lysobacter pythonis]|uniref:NAD-dependent epimerase/dehydratase domain-containing protein n=1 Tax=Solilutibacter pythonis TaxID=2483112 RepID=A0A3M2I034_9GAMM|nr:NAD-dependent epimerase/dehydratase family protein [Lysobacter pythonis]RMH93503.1 hypothetical protein EBB59_04435 [Lysobacter pythonis]
MEAFRLVVSGASSQLGWALRERLAEERLSLTALSRQARPAQGDETWLRADLDAGWPALPPQDAMVSFGPMRALADALSRLAAAPFARLVATSSMSAISKRDSPVAEDRRLSAELREAEAALMVACARLGIGWTILRPTMIYGVGRDRNLTPFAHRAMRTRLFPYPLAGGLRQPVHACDVAEAAWRALHRREAEGRIIEIGGGERLRGKRMWRRVRRSLPVASLPLPVPSALPGLFARVLPGWRGPASRLEADLVADNTQLQSVLGFVPRPFRPDAGCWVARP